VHAAAVVVRTGAVVASSALDKGRVKVRVVEGIEEVHAKPQPAKAVDKQNHAELQSDVEKLYALAFELREQIKMTDSTSTMSVTIVKQAQQIEKLAKQIKDRAKR
jgi:hypothetical protein